jgi:cytochrome-b5 reductase
LLAPLPSSYSGFLLLSQYAPLWEDISSSTTVPQSHLCTVAVETSLTLFPTEQKKVLDPAVFKEFPLTEKTILSHNTAIYRFALPTPNSILGLPIGQHISIAANLDVKDPKTETVTNKEVVRSYTPISSDVDPGYFDLLIKSYPTGNISRHLATLKIGDKMKVKGPKGAMVYTPNLVRHFGMIAGGTGITPMLQVAKAIIRGRSSGDKTQVDLIFANVNEEDILMKQDLDKLTREDSGFRVHYVLNNPPEGWTGGVGFVTGDMIKVRSKDSFVASASELIACNRNFSPPLPRTSRSSFAAHLPWSAP